ncbi:GNVR domain-containing protein [Sulfitobacter sp. 916]|uniref:GNVR domain-containing protein n=1 Tax=Sulfitobacter sp. 916 TaxID=3368559 RepID=UPI0037453ED8
MRSQDQLTALRASEAELSAQVSQQSCDLITLQQLTREAEASRVLYEHFLSRLNETTALQGNHRANSRILSHAVVPLRHSTPRRTLIIAMSAAFGLLASLAVVLGREMQRDGFSTARELEAATGHPVLGQIPKMALKGANVAEYLADAPTSAAAEALRDLRTSVLQLDADRGSQVVVITSSVAGEGATTAAIALAQSLHGLGNSVLLIDGDIRAGGLSQHFSGPPVKALSLVLQEEATLEEGIQNIRGYGLDALLCDDSDPATSDLFASDRFKRLIEKARQVYDTVIIDTPPILLAPTGRIVAEHGDATLLMVQSDRTCRGQVEEALRTFRNSGQSITGTVFNQARGG